MFENFFKFAVRAYFSQEKKKINEDLLSREFDNCMKPNFLRGYQSQSERQQLLYRIGKWLIFLAKADRVIGSCLLYLSHPY